MTVTGISNETINTLGSIEITLFEKPIVFQVIDEELPLPIFGILGANFLSEESAQISFRYNASITSLRPIEPIRFINYYYRHPKPTKFIIKARTIILIKINLLPNKLVTGYVPRIKTPDDIFIGEAVVTSKDQYCFLMTINSYEDDAEVEISPQEL